MDSSRLLKLVPGLLPGVLVTQGKTPRLAAAAESLREHVAPADAPRGLETLTTYFNQDVTPEVVQGFFEAAAALYGRRPWRRFPSEGHRFQVTCIPLGIRGWSGCVIGQHGESHGVILFDSVEDYGRYVQAAERLDAGDEPATALFPAHRVINFEAPSAMPKGLLREIRQHDWPVADGDAFPTVMLVEPDRLLMPPRRMDVWRLELIALALCEWLDTEPQLAGLWQQATPPRRRRFPPQGGRDDPAGADRCDPSERRHWRRGPVAGKRHPAPTICRQACPEGASGAAAARPRPDGQD